LVSGKRQVAAARSRSSQRIDSTLARLAPVIKAAKKKQRIGALACVCSVLKNGGNSPLVRNRSRSISGNFWMPCAGLSPT